jgi:cobalamin biosynthesis protein CbiD
MRHIRASVPASISVEVDVPDGATPEQVAAAIVDTCPSYPDVTAGVTVESEDELTPDAA